LEGFAPLIVFSGGYGKLTKHIWNTTEAEKFARIAMDMGVPETSILIEDKSSNTGENILFVKDLINNKKIKVQKIMRSTSLIWKEGPMPHLKALGRYRRDCYLSPDGAYGVSCGLPEREITEDEVINVMVGDLQRIRCIPKKASRCIRIFLKRFGMHT